MLKEENKTEPWGRIMFRSRKSSHKGHVRIITLQSSKGQAREFQGGGDGQQYQMLQGGWSQGWETGYRIWRLGSLCLHSCSLVEWEKNWDLKDLGEREKWGSSSFLTWRLQHLTSTFPLLNHFPLFLLLWCNILTSPQVPSRAPCSLSPFKCQGFKGSVFSSCLCLSDKLSYSWRLQWCLPLGNPTSLSAAWDSPQASDTHLVLPIGQVDAPEVQQPLISGTQLISCNQNSPPNTCFPISTNYIYTTKRYNPTATA